MRLKISGGNPYTKEYFEYFQVQFKNYYYIPVSDKVSIFKIHFFFKKIKDKMLLLQMEFVKLFGNRQSTTLKYSEKWKLTFPQVSKTAEQLLC